MNSTQEEQEQEEENNPESTMILETQELMVPPLTHNDSPTIIKHTHFLKPSQITPENPTIPKSPSSLVSSDPNIIKNLTRLISFKGIKVPNDSWKTWVNSLINTHESTWKKAGIFDAIKGSTNVVKRDEELIIKLANYWCPETNTFVFPWGECTITLEDVMILGGFSVLGDCVVNVPKSSDCDDEINKMLVNSCVEIKRKNNYHVPFYDWIKYFKGRGGELENVGLIVNWLSRYVFCVDQFDIDVNSFGFAIHLSQGRKIALAPAVLASIYRDLSLLKTKLVALNGECDGGEGSKSKLVLWSPMQFVQLWAWERFPKLSPKPKLLVRGEPRIARWDYVSKLKTDRMNLIMESGIGSFLWRPYAMDVENWELPKFYSDEGKWVVINEEVDEDLVCFARCLRVCELVCLDCVEQYLPHRVGLQFGLDQDIPGIVPRLIDDMKLVWSSYDKSVDGLKLYLPPRLIEGDVTVQYSKLWRRNSPLEDVESTGPEKPKKRKRVRSKKAKNPSTSEAPQLCTSQASDITLGLQPCGSQEFFSRKKLTPVKSEASQPANLGDGIVSNCMVNSLTEVEGTIRSDEVTLVGNGVDVCHLSKDNSGKVLENSYSEIYPPTSVIEGPVTKESLQGPDTDISRQMLSKDEVMKYHGPFDSLRMEFWREDRQC